MTQKHTFIIDSKNLKPQHPITYVSGLFWGSKHNQAALTKKA